ncbi:MAG: hypoxanthine phosphoribosyltransferase [Desulfobacteraceae bacterium]|nr:MAG: hypoxanthine phosphoribosyltransferase [Desulfobacteraceae bacterium]
MPELTPVLDTDAIARKVDEVARQISSDYRNADLVIIGVLKGAFVFMADLIRRLDLSHVAVDFIRLASYGSQSNSSGHIRLLKNFEIDIEGKHVLIVEDILDTGWTLAFLKQHLSAYSPRSLKTCVLVDKRERRKVDVQAEYVCHVANEGFLVGYGLDYDENYRNLPGIFNLKL